MDGLALRLLERLLRGGGGPVAGLAGALGCGLGAVVGAAEALRGAGCVIDEHPQGGLSLSASGLGCWADYVEWRHGSGLGGRCLVYRETASTQEAARRAVRRWSDEGRGRGLVVLADHQSAGRGRLGRRWVDRPGEAVLMTVALRGGATADRLMLGACIAVCETVEALGGPAPTIRWPNDVLIDGRKLAGMLIEREGEDWLLGLGLNVGAADEATDEATDEAAGGGVEGGRPASLRAEGVASDRLRVVDALLGRLGEAVGGRDDAGLLAGWRARSGLVGRRATASCDGRELRGRVVDLDAREGLVMAVDRGPIVRLPAATTRLSEVGGV